ncbi:serine/threonine protein kinase [Stanieria cyanosphaera PCC 7437]|uniref:non-specific serine/threonine protein kinase n=1 Tax=Stanieria cyanosphaera (strain ATCC 29371 / PCC 7437) TaxID=111780 RepID=K9XWY3_STAC7|nr:serine/threonine-protein kinase [Stanieria cyanosphaera]AFZ36177.1 serine/threonine protein kinase [Stanieria cyanosphaera PCC 7437]
MQGQILSSRYQIIEPLGQGGFGKTYLAEDTQLPGYPQCVVKQFNPSFNDPKFLDTARRLFKTEAETLQKLGNHPQIPQLLAHFEQEQEFYLVQQFIDGHTLSQELVSGKCWSQTKVIEFLQDCLNILDFVHSNGVIHRDVKPDNIIRRRQDNKVVLVDFGTVKEVVLAQTQLVNSTVAVGTRGYMPTEQARGKPRITSDIYALGIIAIQALIGVHPVEFQEDENGEFVWQSQANVNPQLAAVIAKMVRYHFKDRYQSAKEVLEELVNIQVTQISRSSKVEYTPTNILNLDEQNTAAKIAPGTEIVTQEKEVLETNNPLEKQSVINNYEEKNVSQTSPSKINSSYVAKTKQTQETSTSIKNTSQNNLTVKLKAFFQSETGKVVSVGLLIGAIATGGMYLFNDKAAKAQEQKRQGAIATLEELKNKKSYEECYQQTDSDEIKQAGISEEERLKIKGECGLSWAQEKASYNEFAEAFDIASEIDDKIPNYNKVQEYKEQWAEAILKQATEIYQKEGNLEKAIATIAQIKSGSSVKGKSLDLKQQWEEDYQKNARLFEASEAAISQGFWDSANSKAQEIINNAKQSHSFYWEQQGLGLKKQAETELKKLSEPNPPKNPDLPKPANSNSVPVADPPIPIKSDPKPEKPKQPTNPVIVEPPPPIDLCDGNNALITGDSCP